MIYSIGGVYDTNIVESFADEVLVEKIIRECSGIKVLASVCLSTHNELAIIGTILLRKLSKFGKCN